MPFALVFIGLVLIVTGAKDTYQQLGKELTGDFTGTNNFTYWLASMGAVGAVGYVDALRPVSRLFLALILIAMVLRNGGVFQNLQAALAAGPTHPAQDQPAADATATANGSPVPTGFPSATTSSTMVPVGPQVNFGALGSAGLNVQPGSLAGNAVSWFGQLFTH